MQRLTQDAPFGNNDADPLIKRSSTTNPSTFHGEPVLYITGFHYAAEAINSIGYRWLVPPKAKTMLKYKARCGILFTGTLRVDEEEAYLWMDGIGTLQITDSLSNNTKISCQYMTNVGIFPKNPRVWSSFTIFYFHLIYLL